MTAFFTPIFPLAPLISLFHYIFMYWSSKIQLLKVCKRPPQMSEIMFKKAVIIIPLSALMFIISFIIFYVDLETTE